MKYKPANKCQRCSIYTDAGGFCDHLSGPELEKLSGQSRTATLKRGKSIGSEELLMWPIIAISSGVISMQPETVSHCFRDMENRGIIALQNILNIKILNVPTLRRIANGDKNTDNLRHTDADHFKVLSYG